MTTSERCLGAPRAQQRFLFAALCIVGIIAAGCGYRSKDVTNDPAYGNFSTVTGRWKTKETLTLVSDNRGLHLWTKSMSDQVLRNTTVKALATLPPGTEVSVEHLVLHPSFECDTFTRSGSLVSGPYAGQPLELDPYLFALNQINTYYTGNPVPAPLPRGWQVNPEKLKK